MPRTWPHLPRAMSGTVCVRPIPLDTLRICPTYTLLEVQGVWSLAVFTVASFKMELRDGVVEPDLVEIQLNLLR